MEQVINTINKFSPKAIVTTETSAKGIFGTRHIQVSYNKAMDTFSIYAFTLKGIKISKEQTIDNIYINDLTTTIHGLI